MSGGRYCLAIVHRSQRISRALRRTVNLAHSSNAVHTPSFVGKGKAELGRQDFKVSVRGGKVFQKDRGRNLKHLQPLVLEDRATRYKKEKKAKNYRSLEKGL
jgi:hypothetical protein